MPIATELAIDVTADATTLAQTIFGNGVTIGTATLTGAAGASGTYSGADATLGGIVPGDAGIILSTGQAADFTNSSNTTDTNTAENGASTDNGQAGDALLDAETGQSTQDAVVLEVTFTPVGDYITMLFTFSSEEYLEYVNGGVNDAFGVWVNNVYVPFNPVPGGVVSIDTVNSTNASNLFIDNPVASDTYNTEMDGTTQVLSINAAVNTGQLNTIRIALGDGGDGIYDTNVLIAANSVQTIAVAFDDAATVEANTATTVSVLDNDIDTTGNGLTITEINGTPVTAGQTVTLPTGEQVTLNADNTLTILSDSDLGSEPFTYTVVYSAGNADVAFVTLTTEADIPLNYVVEGTSSSDTINAGYSLDPQGDMIDAGDALDGSNNDSVEAGAGNDVIDAGAGDDTINAGSGNDEVFAGAGNDSVIAGDDNDTVFGQDGNDTLLGGGGADALDGDAGDDSLEGGGGDDTLIADAGNDTLLGGAGNDEMYGSTGNNYMDGGSNNDLIFGGDQADTILGGSGFDTISGGSGNDSIDGGADADRINGDDGNDTLLGGIGDDTISGGLDDDSIDGGDGADRVSGDDGNDTVSGGAGNDSVFGGAGDDSLSGGTGNDSMESWIGNDTLDGGEGDDYLDGSDGNDSLLGGDGNDTLLGGNTGGQDTLEGGAGNDSLSAGDGDDILNGGTGDDTLFGASGDDLNILKNGFGNDVISGGETGETKGDTLDLSAVTDNLTVDLTSANPEAGTVSDGTDTATFSEIENIVLGAGIDTLVLADGSGDDTVEGFTAPTDDGAGNWTGFDQIDVSGMTDANGALVNTDDVTVSDTNGDGTGDAILIFPGSETITLIGVSASTFNDAAALGAIGIPMPNYIVEGTTGNDNINAAYTGDPEGDMVDANDSASGTNDDSIEAGAGNDTISSGLGDDTIMGGDGDDYIIAGSGNDEVFGEAGNDVMFGFDGDDTMSGGDGSDVLNGMTGNDLLDGGNDNDTFVVEAAFGTDTIVGGEGVTTGTDFDTIRINTSAVTDPVTVVFSSDEAGTISDGTDTLGFSEIERVRTSNNNDTIDGTATTNGINVDAVGGDDSVTGGTGSDTISGGSGNDTLVGGLGADFVSGGTGDDAIQAAQGDTLDGGDGDDTFTLVDLGESGAGSITINGGEGGETGGDTLDLNGIADRTTINITNPIDVGGGISGTVQLLDGTVVNFNNIENIICFVPGTMVATHTGLRKIEDMRIGDKVITQDNGLQKIGWIGSTTVRGTGKFAPVTFAKSVFPGAMDDLTVSPQHRMLIKGYQAELLFGQSEVLVPAVHLVDGKDVVCEARDSVTYIHIMFEQHEIIFANGIPAESFHPAAFGVDTLAEDARAELFELFPELRSNMNGYGPTARMALKAREAKVLSEFSY